MHQKQAIKTSVQTWKFTWMSQNAFWKVFLSLDGFSVKITTKAVMVKAANTTAVCCFNLSSRFHQSNKNTKSNHCWCDLLVATASTLSSVYWKITCISTQFPAENQTKTAQPSVFLPSHQSSSNSRYHRVSLLWHLHCLRAKQKRHRWRRWKRTRQKPPPAARRPLIWVRILSNNSVSSGQLN